MLPFANLSGDPQQDYFSDGIADDIITELSRFSELLVIARNSSFQYKGKAARFGHGLAGSDRSVFGTSFDDASLVSVGHRAHRGGAGAWVGSSQLVQHLYRRQRNVSHDLRCPR